MEIKDLLRRIKRYICPVAADPVVDTDEKFANLVRKYTPYTMTSKMRLYALYKSVHYIIDNDIPGDFVECGVWRGGNTMLIADILQSRGITDRTIYLYDTFEGMSEPQEIDVIAGSDFKQTQDLWNKTIKDTHSDWCYANLDEVKKNMDSTGYPAKQLVYVKGKVEETLDKHVPSTIALLRLDTDWYESTKKELLALYPKLTVGGVLIIDDYGTWEGARKAVDEYFNQGQILLSRIDHTGRIGIKVAHT